MRATQIGDALISKYIARRQSEEASNSTINRELAVLKRGFSLAVQAKRVPLTSVPSIPHLAEPHARRGFLDDRQVSALCDACSRVGLWLRAMLEVGRLYGCRVAELKELKVGQVDVNAGTIHLEETKNDEDRAIPMTSTVAALLKQCVTAKESSDFVFTRDDGEPIRDFRDSWANVCEEAGVPELLFHDLRRTGVRNMIRSGIPQKVAMLISGHKTDSVFKRYQIIDGSDLRDAARKMEEAEQVRARTSIVTPALQVVGGRAVQ